MRKRFQNFSLLAGAALLGSCFLFVDGLGAASCDDATFLERCDGATRTFCEDDFINHETCAQTCTTDAGIARCILCGNGQVEPGEECDDDIDCRDDCTIPFCGDGIVDLDEVCDGEPGCSVSCQALCGNLIIEAGVICDDQNLVNGDGCRADCTGLEICGDGIIDEGEECDDSNNTSADGCSGSCVLEFCGDNIINFEPAFEPDFNPIETCDDGNAIDGDGCDQNCTLTGCGNLIASPGELCLGNDFVSIDVAVGFPAGIAVGDIDGINGPDIVFVKGLAGKAVVLFNDGNGVFSAAQSKEFDTGVTLADPRDVALGDLDGDQDLDIAIAHLGTDEVFVLNLSNAGQDAVALQLASGDATIAVKIIDINNDQRLDIVSLNRTGASVSVFLQDAVGGFVKTDFAVGNFSLSLAVGDLDGDLDLDLMTADRNSQQLSVLLNNGAGAFPVSVAIDASGKAVHAVALVDFDQDATLDVFSSFDSGVSSLEFRKNVHPGGVFSVASLGGPVLQDPAFASPGTALIEVANLNNQLATDLLFVPSNGTFALSLLEAGQLSQHALTTINGSIKDIVVGDFNEDGAADLAAAISNGAAETSISVTLAKP